MGAEEDTVIVVTLLVLTGVAQALNDKMVHIPAGAFRMGCSAGDTLCQNDEGPPGGVQVDVPGFFIDRHEASVAQFRSCVEAGACERPFDYQRTHYCNYGAPGRDDYPVNCVNWNLAHQFCAWRDARLAWEAEWEKAARGGTLTPYWWGSTPADCTRAVMDPGQPEQADTETDGCWRDLSWPRGRFAPNPFGLYDMIGGTSEWVANWYDKNAYSEHYAHGDLHGPSRGTHKVIKGGAWDEKHAAQRVSNRFSKPVTGNPDLYGSNGIRCAMDEAPWHRAMSRDDVPASAE